MHNLNHLFVIQKTLNSLNYPDVSRISKEIEGYVKNDKTLEHVLNRLRSKEPWEYIRGEAEFKGLMFRVNKHVLIPRIETEQLVDMALKELERGNYDVVIDIGTGSGCIVITLRRELPNSKSIFIATDISRRALNIAKYNSKKFGLDKEILFTLTDLFMGIDISKKRVLFIANLPYIPTEQYDNLESCVRDFEPKLALDGGIDGNEYYKELERQIENSNVKSFTLFLETESSIINSTREVFNKYSTDIKKDIFKRNRFISVRG